MLKVGVIGLGMMGNTHLDVYTKRRDVEIVAISDANPDRLSGKVKAAGNIEGQAQGGFSFETVAKYPEGMELIRDKRIDLVDVCLTTPLHLKYAQAALKAGKHVLCEKPMARTFREAQKLAQAAAKSDRMFMVAMCMRFWPGWTWLKDAVANQAYGRVLAAQFRRVSSHPGGAFYSDGAQCGGAILDLHIHDTDFIQYAFGTPNAVSTVGYRKQTSHPDHVVTAYAYDDIPLVVAEGGWVMSPGFGFRMQYAVNFERATAVFDLAAPSPLTLHEPGAEGRGVELQPAMGYELEIDYFLGCIARGERPSVVTPESAAESVRIVEAEQKSMETGRPVKLKAASRTRADAQATAADAPISA